LRKHPRQARFRHVIPAMFVASLAGSAVLAVAWPPGRVLAAAVVGSYAAANLGASLIATRRTGLDRLPTVAAIFATLHLTYGLGFIAGSASWVTRRRGRPLRGQ
jgi:succinoglycan biosynthesis protein ExoA